MSFAEVLEELPSLTFVQRQMLVRRAVEFNETGRPPSDEAIVEARLAGHHSDPDSSIPLEQMKQRLRSQ